jgi:hypothetical protein
VERRRIAETAVRLHELQAHAGQGSGDAVDVATQHRRQIGVGDGGVAARHQAHQWAYAMRHRHLRVADAPGNRLERAFVRRVTISMQQRDGAGANPACIRCTQRRLGRRLVECAHHVAVCAHALVDLDDFFVEHRG